MRRRCLDERRRTVRSASGAFVIGDRFAEELAAAARLPRHAFDPCVEQPGRRRQVPDGGVRRQPLQRAAALGVPGGDGQGLRRPGRGRRRRPGRGRARRGATGTRSRSSTRCTTWRRWNAARRRWTTRRCTATGSRRRRWPGYAASWRRSTACRAGRGSSSGSCNCSASTRSRGSSGRSRRAAPGTPSRPRRSSSGPGRWRRPRPGGHPRSIVHVKQSNLPRVSVPPPDLSRFNRLLGGEASAGPVIET